MNRKPPFQLLRSPVRSLFLAFVIGMGMWAWATMRFETELISILPQSLPSVRGLQDFSTLAAGQDDVYVVPGPDLPAVQRAEWLAKIRPALAEVPNVARVEFPSEELVENAGVFAAWLLVNAPPVTFQRAQAALRGEEAAWRLAEIPEKLAGAVDPVELEMLRLDPLGLREVLGFGDGPGFAMPQPSFLVVSPLSPSVLKNDSSRL